VSRFAQRHLHAYALRRREKRTLGSRISLQTVSGVPRERVRHSMWGTEPDIKTTDDASTTCDRGWFSLQVDVRLDIGRGKEASKG
jgi:hypothetical protein